ncbi:MAG: 50S ribosomal protein L23 [Candidatus Chisholmbacteria bacterium RIFCSPHIGHO2_01_FULL_49_18]|jgi:large subunit ribosomal protein L23|uniref:Large ribosomal subunit protein uL23 n=2 Tax=Candidatus Chisholmiibacteriota TaxID=1817900 RepID=A0A1G1VLT7_9BACT|nr:MAG: 50S ribosomal protein L23 [Candidatus Chisholmbacteria bacterium RIFCSPHIGHO2_01_FULL_49_18]OGY19373.1 MAG: 50S ribosomal protein L23 [Candidatus Chisholmbacteria bacterium RIFCSPLOWO2_01_FULL_49_14]
MWGAILKRPLITEKSMAQTAANRYSFEVERSASKGQIREAVEKTFAVDVLSVQTIKIAGKKRRTGRMRRLVEKPAGKKAFVTIKEGQKIDIVEKQT